MTRFGDKPLSQMTRDECLEAITTLRNEREALRAEGVKRFKEEKVKREVKVAKKDVAVGNIAALKMLMGED